MPYNYLYNNMCTDVVMLTFPQILVKIGHMVSDWQQFKILEDGGDWHRLK